MEAFDHPVRHDSSPERAVEPNPVCKAILNSNVYLNDDCVGLVQIIDGCLASKRGTIELEISHSPFRSTASAVPGYREHASGEGVDYNLGIGPLRIEKIPKASSASALFLSQEPLPVFLETPLRSSRN